MFLLAHPRAADRASYFACEVALSVTPVALEGSGTGKLPM